MCDAGVEARGEDGGRAPGLGVHEVAWAAALRVFLIFPPNRIVVRLGSAGTQRATTDLTLHVSVLSLSPHLGDPWKNH